MDISIAEPPWLRLACLSDWSINSLMLLLFVYIFAMGGCLCVFGCPPIWGDLLDSSEHPEDVEISLVKASSTQHFKAYQRQTAQVSQSSKLRRLMKNKQRWVWTSLLNVCFPLRGLTWRSCIVIEQRFRSFLFKGRLYIINVGLKHPKEPCLLKDSCACPHLVDNKGKKSRGRNCIYLITTAQHWYL